MLGGGIKELIQLQGVFFCSVWRPRWRPPTPPKASTRHTQHTSDPKEGALQAKRDRGGDAHLAAALQPAASTAAAARCTAGTRRATTAARTSGVERAARGREVHGRPARHSSGSRSIASSKDTPAPQVHVAQNARPRRVEKYSRTSWGSTTATNRKSPTVVRWALTWPTALRSAIRGARPPSSPSWSFDRDVTCRHTPYDFLALVGCLGRVRN